MEGVERTQVLIPGSFCSLADACLEGGSLRNLDAFFTGEIKNKVNNKHVFNKNDWGDWRGEPVLED